MGKNGPRGKGGVEGEVKRRGKRRALWSKTAKNKESSTGPLAHPFARSLTPSLVGKGMIRRLFCLCFFPFFEHSEGLERGKREWDDGKIRFMTVEVTEE